MVVETNVDKGSMYCTPSQRYFEKTPEYAHVIANLALIAQNSKASDACSL